MFQPRSLRAPRRRAASWTCPAGTIIDGTTAFETRSERDELGSPGGGSVAGQIAAIAKGASLLKALHQRGPGDMTHAGDVPSSPVMLVAGDETGSQPAGVNLSRRSALRRSTLEARGGVFWNHWRCWLNHVFRQGAAGMLLSA